MNLQHPGNLWVCGASHRDASYTKLERKGQGHKTQKTGSVKLTDNTEMAHAECLGPRPTKSGHFPSACDLQIIPINKGLFRGPLGSVEP